MKITKTFYFQYGSQYPSQVDYESNVNPEDIVNQVASIYINIPFKVSKIHVKKMSYVSGQNASQGNAGCANYVTATSSLVGGRPVGMVFRDSQFSMNTIQDIEHSFQIPKLINGFYDFTFFSNAGKPYNHLNGTYYPFYYTETILFPFPPIYNYWFDSFHITMEFNSEEEL
jgi:hypothetical protein